MTLSNALVDVPGDFAVLGSSFFRERLTKLQPDRHIIDRLLVRGQKPSTVIPTNANPNAQFIAGWDDSDPLTGLPTRQQFLKHLEYCLQTESSDEDHSALLLLELDHFKDVNDALGPTTGDKLLRRAAARICSKAPTASIVARVSGNGFAILLPERGNAAAAAGVLLDFLARPFAIDGQLVTITVSIGIAGPAADVMDAPKIFHAAELALHKAQLEQQNCVKHFDQSMFEDAARRQTLETDLRSAVASQNLNALRDLHTQQFTVHYQPKVRLATGRVTGFEALLRWRHPDLGQISPDRFIPLAEETGLIDIMGEWVLRTACHDAAQWLVPDDGVPLGVAVNVSPLQLRDGAALVAAISQALCNSGLEPHRLELELTESALVGDIGDTLAAIRALGVGLALDDFGTGHSSLSRLHLYPFTRLKIDRSFVVALDRTADPEAHRVSELMLRAIVLLGSSLGLDTIVEGIENQTQLEIACRTGCSEMQGYFASPPVPLADVPAIIGRVVTMPCLAAGSREC